jgi:hypothetical protein
LRSNGPLVCLPIHYAARHSTLNVVESLLEAYTESLYVTTNCSESLLDCALFDYRQDEVKSNAIVKYLCDRNPAFLPLSEENGFTLPH